MGFDSNSKSIACVLLERDSGNWVDSFLLESNLKEADKRLLELSSDLLMILREKKIIRDNYTAFIELPIYLQNPKTTILLAQVVTAVKLACAQREVPYLGVDNLVWKKGVLGSGKVSKEQIADFGNIRWGKEQFAGSQDLSDAACVALWGVLRLRQVV